jgi:hypothetical protein
MCLSVGHTVGTPLDASAPIPNYSVALALLGSSLARYTATSTLHVWLFEQSTTQNTASTASAAKHTAVCAGARGICSFWHACCLLQGDAAGFQPRRHSQHQRSSASSTAPSSRSRRRQAAAAVPTQRYSALPRHGLLPGAAVLPVRAACSSISGVQRNVRAVLVPPAHAECAASAISRAASFVPDLSGVVAGESGCQCSAPQLLR